jgi:hypothetical protein
MRLSLKKDGTFIVFSKSPPKPPSGMVRGVPLLERKGKDGRSVLWALKFLEVFGRSTCLQDVSIEKIRALNDIS